MNRVRKAIFGGIDHRLAAQEFFQQCRTARTVNPGETNHNATFPESQILSFTQNFSSLGSWCGRAFSAPPFAVYLRVTARAADKKNSRSAESPKKITHTVQINAAIKIDIAAAGAGAMNHRIEVPFLSDDLIF